MSHAELREAKALAREIFDRAPQDGDHLMVVGADVRSFAELGLL